MSLILKGKLNERGYCKAPLADSETAVSEKIGSLTIQQKLFVFPYGDIDGDEKTILCEVGFKLRDVSSSVIY